MSIDIHQDNAQPRFLNKWGNADRVAFLLITILWLMMVISVNPIGDFPLNDDWAYAASVKTLIDTGHFVLPDWSAPNLFMQTIWGTLFGSVFGYSFTVLRISTLILGLVGLIAIYRLLREINVSSGISLIGVAAITVNPIFFASSNTFMTEVPFLSFSVIALLFLTKALYEDNFSSILIGTAAAVLALLIRQLGFAIPIAFAFSYLIGTKITSDRAIKAMLPLIACLVAHMSFKTWLRLDGQMPAMYGYQIQQIENMLAQPVLTIIEHFGKSMIYALIYLCLFALPILLLVAFSRGFMPNWRKTGLFLLISSGIIWGGLHNIGARWPLLGNLVGTYGIGPMYYFEPDEPYLTHVKLFSWVIGFLSIISVWLMLFILYLRWVSIRLDVKESGLWALRPMIFFGVATLVYLLPVASVDYLFDRYLLFPILATILFCLSPHKTQPDLVSSRLGATLALCVTIGMGVITVAVTHDYLSWNRVRWMALNDLTYGKKIAPSRIDGGFEFNGMYLYDANQIKPNAKGWWVVDNEFLIALSKRTRHQRRDYVVDTKYPVNSWLPYSPHYVYVMRRSSLD